MWQIAVYMGFIALGVFVGRKGIPKGRGAKYTDKALMGCVFLLVFMLGTGIGSDEKVISSIGSIGAVSFAITVFAMAGSVFGIAVLRRILKIDRRGMKRYE